MSSISRFAVQEVTSGDGSKQIIELQALTDKRTETPAAAARAGGK